MENLNKAKQLITEADVVVVAAGNGMAKVEGLDLLGQSSFADNFPAIAKKYHVASIGDALDQEFSSWSDQWLFWSELIKKYSLDYQPSQTMKNLRKLIGQRKYFIATATFGHFFENAGFNENRVFNIFGDWTKMQCSSGINHGLKDSRGVVQKILLAEHNGEKISGFIPKCNKCGRPMEIHMPLNGHFYPDTDANARFRWFLTGNEEEKTVFLELGVDETSPQLREPIIHLVQQYQQWSYVAADYQQDYLPLDIQKRSAGVNADVAVLLEKLL